MTSSTPNFPPLLRDRPEAERQQWARWVLGSHSDQFLPEMLMAVEKLDHSDPITAGSPVINPGAAAGDLLGTAFTGTEATVTVAEFVTTC